MRLAAFARLALLLFAAAATLTARAAPAPEDCASLLRADFSRLPDAPTTITGARRVEATADLPAHCSVDGFVAPQVQFNLRLPARGWNRKFLMQGCGGLCGSVNPATCDDVLARNYAVAVTDMGHRAQPWQSAWAHDNLPAEIDFAYRATHVVTVAAKAIMAAYFSEPAQRAYFQGCSTGGRQGLVAAQRFPTDYDGIIAGAPVLNETGVAALHLIWSGRANLDADGRPVLSAAKAAFVHQQVIAACDAHDGLADGIIGEPRECPWKPADSACPQAGVACLTAAEQTVITRLYDGAVNARGVALLPGGLMRGSEYEWVPNFIGRDGPAVFDPRGPVSDLYRYLIFMPDPGPGPTAMDFDFERDPPRLALMESLYSAMNPDLSRFRGHGGKLIVYHGWDDAEIPPPLMLRYFELLQATMGGPDTTATFARLFMLPGVAHCRRGPGADTADWLTALERWVEHGEAPDPVLTYHLVRAQDYLGLPRVRFPLRADQYDWARPVFAYPGVAHYRGTGAPADPANWQRAAAGR
jgi:feruloyl esterase